MTPDVTPAFLDDLDDPVIELLERVERLEHRVETLEGEPERTNARVIELDDATDPDLLTGEAAPDAKERIDMAHSGGPKR